MAKRLKNSENSLRFILKQFLRYSHKPQFKQILKITGIAYICLKLLHFSHLEA